MGLTPVPPSVNPRFTAGGDPRCATGEPRPAPRAATARPLGAPFRDGREPPAGAAARSPGRRVRAPLSAAGAARAVARPLVPSGIRSTRAVPARLPDAARPSRAPHCLDRMVARAWLTHFGHGGRRAAIGATAKTRGPRRGAGVDGSAAPVLGRSAGWTVARSPAGDRGHRNAVRHRVLGGRKPDLTSVLGQADRAEASQTRTRWRTAPRRPGARPGLGLRASPAATARCAAGGTVPSSTAPARRACHTNELPSPVVASQARIQIINSSHSPVTSRTPSRTRSPPRRHRRRHPRPARHHRGDGRDLHPLRPARAPHRGSGRRRLTAGG
jgi:hypothetical protein